MYIYKEPEFPPVSKFKLPGTFTQEQIDGLRDFILKYPFMSYAASRPYTEIRSINVPAEDFYININAPIDHFFRGGFINLTTGKVYSLFDDDSNYLPEPDVWDMAWGTSPGNYDQTGGITLTLQVGTNGIYVNPDMSEIYQDATLYAECQSEEVEMNIITGYVGEPHITAAQDRAANQGSYGEDSYILNVGSKLTATASSATEIHIADGAVSHQGCVGVIDQGTYDVVEISPGSQGYKRIDLIVCRYERNSDTNEESLSLVAIQGTPAASNPAVPAYTQGDIQGGDLIADMPLFQVLLNGISVQSITKVANAVLTQAELTAAINSIEDDIAALEDDIVMEASGNLLSTSQTIATMKQVAVEVTIPTKTGYSIIAASPRTLTGASNTKVMMELDVQTGYLKLFNTHTSSVTISAAAFNIIYKKN